MHLQCITIGKHVDWACATRKNTERYRSLDLDIFTKFAVFCGEKMFQRQILEEQYTIPIRHITNISDFVWLQRSCGSMKSVSSFRSIDFVF